MKMVLFNAQTDQIFCLKKNPEEGMNVPQEVTLEMADHCRDLKRKGKKKPRDHRRISSTKKWREWLADPKVPRNGTHRRADDNPSMVRRVRSRTEPRFG